MPISSFRTYGNKTVPKLLEKINTVDIVNDLDVGGSGVPASAELTKALNLDLAVETAGRVQGDLDIKGGASVGYNTLRKIEDTVIANKAELEGDIGTEASARATAVSNEASARTSADTTLQSNIDQEANARALAVSNEASVRDTADQALQANIDTEASTRSSAIANEETARANADTALQSAIDQEVSERQADITAVQLSVGNEVTARTNADNALDARLGNVESGMVAGVIIKGEVATLADFDNMAEADQVEGWGYKVISGTTGTNDVYIVIDNPVAGDNVYTPAGWTTKGFLWLMDYADVTNSVNVEKARAIAKEAELQANNDATNATVASNRTLAENARASLQTTLENADSALDTKIDQEIADRGTAVSNEASIRQTADTNLQANIDGEVSARQTAITTEATARVDADALLQSGLDTEIADRQSAVSGEQTARENADTLLDGRLDIVEGDVLVEGSIKKSLADAKTYTDLVMPRIKLEGADGALIVNGDSLELVNVPVDGLNSVLNFGEVVVYSPSGEATLVNIASVSNSTVLLSVQEAGEYNGYQAKIQYVYDLNSDGAGDGGGGEGVAQ